MKYAKWWVRFRVVGGSRIGSHDAGENDIIRNKRWTCERTCSYRRMRCSAAYPTGRERRVVVS